LQKDRNKTSQEKELRLKTRQQREKLQQLTNEYQGLHHHLRPRPRANEPEYHLRNKKYSVRDANKQQGRQAFFDTLT
jgi:hypothetical protein